MHNVRVSSVNMNTDAQSSTIPTQLTRSTQVTPNATTRTGRSMYTYNTASPMLVLYYYVRQYIRTLIPNVSKKYINQTIPSSEQLPGPVRLPLPAHSILGQCAD